MYVPDKSIIDNQTLKLFEELKKILQEQKKLDIASGYFNLNGFQLIQDEIKKVKKFRLLLGKSPEIDDLRLPDLFNPDLFYKNRIRQDLEEEDYKEDKKDATLSLIDFFKKPNVEVRLYTDSFLHGKAYIFEKIAITGSSNFTYSGLTANTELNAVLDQAHAKYIKKEWFEKHWRKAKDFKKEIIKLYEESKLGTKEYTPYQVFIKALFELQKEDILTDTEERIPSFMPESVVDLTRFQEDAVKRIYTRLRTYNGVLIADSVGLGKTWIAKKIIEEFGFYRRKKFLVICPASLDQSLWRKELKELGVSENIIHQEELGKEELDFSALERKHKINPKDIALVVIDESHNFRNPISNRYENLFTLIEKASLSPPSPRIVLMTATPMNNTHWDLYFQLMLLAQNNKKVFIKDGIFDLEKEFKRADKGELSKLNDILQLISIRRTRQYIKENYPGEKYKNEEGKWVKIRFPKRKLNEIHYSLDETYQGLYRNISRKIETGLTLAYYKLEDYRIVGKKDTQELQRMTALSGIFQTVLLKRLESSVEAFRKSIDSQRKFLREFKKHLKKGKIIRKKFYLKYINFFEDELETRDVLELLGSQLEEIKLKEFDKEKLFKDLEKDIKIFDEIYSSVESINEEKDAKLARFKDKLLSLKGKGKILVFSYYTDTVNYLFDSLTKDKNFVKKLGKQMAIIEGSFPVKKRQEVVDEFLEGKTDILFSTDILSEGQNLQKAKAIINYDLHWNPVRMIQRAGRIDRIGTPFKTIFIYNFYPEKELETLLDLVKTLQRKIEMINETIGLDTSVMGELINPKVFGIIRDLKADEEIKEKIMEELEEAQFGGGEPFWQPLKNFGLEKLQAFCLELPHGIQSGLKRNYRGIFFYYQYSDDYHFWHLYDFATDSFITEKSEILKYITCKPDEPRVIPKNIDPYSINDRVREEIKKLFYRSLVETEVRTAAGQKLAFIRKMLDELEHVKSEFLFEEDKKARNDIDEVVVKLNEISFTKKRLQFLRRTWRDYKKDKNWRKLLAKLHDFLKDIQVKIPESQEEFDERKLKLICVDFIS